MCITNGIRFIFYWETKLILLFNIVKKISYILLCQITQVMEKLKKKFMTIKITSKIILSIQMTCVPQNQNNINMQTCLINKNYQKQNNQCLQRCIVQKKLNKISKKYWNN